MPSSIRAQLGLVVLLLLTAIFVRLPDAAAFTCPNYPYPTITNRCVDAGFCGRIAPRATANDDQDQPPPLQSQSGDPLAFAADAQAGAADLYGIADGETRADRGTVASEVEVDTAAPGGEGITDGTGGVNMLSVLRVTDLVFSGPEPEVETRLRFTLDGSFSLLAIAVEAELAGSTVSVLLGGGICDVGSPYLGFDGLRQISRNDSGNADPIESVAAESGLLEGLDLDGVTEFDEGPFTVPTGEPLQLELWMETSVAAFTSGGDASVTGAFTLFLGPADGGPVFELPPGYGADSAQAGIVANRLPAPGTGASVAAAASALAWLGRRRGRTATGGRATPPRRAASR